MAWQIYWICQAFFDFMNGVESAVLIDTLDFY